MIIIPKFKKKKNFAIEFAEFCREQPKLYINMKERSLNLKKNQLFLL